MSKEEQKMNAEYVSIPLSEGDVVVQQIHSAPPSFARRLCRSFVLAFIAYTLFQMVFCDHHHHHGRQYHYMRYHGEEFTEDSVGAMHNGPHHHPGMMGPHHHPGMMGPHGHHPHGMMGPHGHHPHGMMGPHGHHPHGPPPREFFAFAWAEEMDGEEEASLDSPSDSASSDSASSDEEIVAVPAVAREDFVISEESP